MNRIEFIRVAILLRVLAAFARYLVLIPPPLPLQENRHEILRVCTLLTLIIGQLLAFLTSVLQLPFEIQLPLRDRLFYGFHGHQFQGRDLFALISNQEHLFWLNTGETTDSFLQMARETAWHFFMITRRGNPRQRMGRIKLNVLNRLLLVLIWLRRYPHVHTLALMFDVSPQTVSAYIYQGVIILWRHFRSSVIWPNIREWDALRNNWPEFPDAVGSIDVTPHEIQIPSTEPQREFYSGHRHFHLLNTQLICDNTGHIRFLQTGFLGGMHDSQAFRLMEPVGPGQVLDLPNGVVLLADKGYPDNVPLLTPFRQAQIRAMRNNRERRRARKFNRELARKRVRVEHIFKQIKDFKCTSSIWRHPRWLLPSVIEVCTFLTERRITLFQGLL